MVTVCQSGHSLNYWHQEFSEVANIIADEIFESTGFSLAQPPRSLTNEETLISRASGTIIIPVPGTVNFAGVHSLTIFNPHCRITKARADLRASRWHKCQTYGHHKDTCSNSPKCRVCTREHSTHHYKPR